MAKSTQCLLTKELGPGSKAEIVVWVPSKLAKDGNIIKHNGEDGWVVSHVGMTRDDSDLADVHKERRVHRKNTGDSLPKGD